MMKVSPTPAKRPAMPRPSCRVDAVTVPTPSSPISACAVPVHACSRTAASIGFVRSNGPVAAVDRNLVWRAGRVDRAVRGGEVLVEDDRLRAVQRVVGDRRHLVHVLAGGVDDRIVRVELVGGDRVAPLVREHCHDGLRSLDLSAVDELAVFVVGEGDVLGCAERVQRAIAFLDLDERIRGTNREDEPQDCKDDAESAKSGCHGGVPSISFGACLPGNTIAPSRPRDA